MSGVVVELALEKAVWAVAQAPCQAKVSTADKAMRAVHAWRIEVHIGTAICRQCPS
jgi:hypothetical protein